jgi:predicted MPP superfamily phosphohydrolase
VLAGDLIQGSEGIPHARRLVRDHVRARYRRFCILGNAEHKLKGPRRRAFVDALRADGLTVLVNQNEPLVLRGATITVAGTDDPYYGHADLDATLAGAPPERFCLLLAHSPQVASRGPSRRGRAAVGAHARRPGTAAAGGRAEDPEPARPPRGPGAVRPGAAPAGAGGRDPGGDLLCYVSRGIGVARMHRLPLHPRLFCPPSLLADAAPPGKAEG